MASDKFDRSVRIWINAALKKMDAASHVGLLFWKWNSRMTSTMGRAYLPSYIEFSLPLFEKATPAQRRQVVYHEVAHIVDGYNFTYNPKRPHSKSWRALMHRAGVPALRCHDVPVVSRQRRTR